MMIFAAVLIIALTLTEVYCGWWLYGYAKERSIERSEQRRAAIRPRVYKQVHDAWALERNRRSLWETLRK